MKIPEELFQIQRENVVAEMLPADNNHDPSNILFHNGRYYLWYTQHDPDRPYDHFADCRIRCCTSEDGYHWDRHFDALLPAENGWDSAGVLTANVIQDGNRFFMFYTGVGADYAAKETTRRCCGLAVSDNPDGIFNRISDAPVLMWGEEGSWNDESVDDVSAVYFRGKWMIYFKGTRFSEPAADKTRLGVAFADHIGGPYQFYENNPIILGHAFSIWPYKDGLCLLTGLKHKEGEGTIYGDDWNNKKGVQYLYYSDDGLNFVPCSKFDNRATGMFVPDGDLKADIQNYWGVSVSTRDTHKKRYIERFNIVCRSDVPSVNPE